MPQVSEVAGFWWAGGRPGIELTDYKAVGRRPLIGAPANIGQNRSFLPKGQPTPPNCLLAQIPGPLTPQIPYSRVREK